MNTKGMNMFLSEDNIKRHCEHLKTLKLCFSILEKSLSQPLENDINQILKMNIEREVKSEASELLWKIKSHELFFSSFSEKQVVNGKILNGTISKEKFLYDIFVELSDKDYGFFYVCLNNRGQPYTVFTQRFDGAFLKYSPILALDLYEHTYFCDYGFDKKRFLKSALTYLDLSLLDNSVEKMYN